MVATYIVYRENFFTEVSVWKSGMVYCSYPYSRLDEILKRIDDEWNDRAFSALDKAKS